MAKQLNVNLSFTADTKQAQTELEKLQIQLTKIIENAGKSPLGFTKEISSAVSEVSKLQVALKRATTDTGTLDLGKFKTELKTAKLSADSIAKSLSSLGNEGQAAFAKITQSILKAEIPIRKTNKIFSEFATTLKNTARWQLSSSILHGFMGTLQGAYGYAKDLNESLNDIRIVTGKSVDEMANFAKEANNAAQELSTTTTAYTDAALIFYQQGLNDNEVIDRTNVVVKLANVTKESAEEVSSSMTAIWNNFYDGSQSLEYYADVITALGAATASSSAEISKGLEKFAAIGQTVGLSYEYATSAIAAVIANTRQSADVVGTSFRTIFARLQGLQLGDTLEDGVDLNKYSEALEKIGVEVLDLNGELKSADSILEDTAARWDLLSRAEKTALAQTVAGTRQYAQFMAIMEGWDDIEDNLNIIADSEGSLQEQQEIFEEGWEGASKRLKASLQEIYNQLLDDEFFIKLTNGFTSVVQSISNVIEALGGLKGMIPIISGLFFKMFGADLSSSIDNFVFKLQEGSQKGQEAIFAERKAFNDSLIALKDDGSAIGSAMIDIYTQQGNIQNDLITKTKELENSGRSLTESEQLRLNILMDINTQLGQQYLKNIQHLETLKERTQELKKQALIQATQVVDKTTNKPVIEEAELQKQINKIEELQIHYQTINKLKEEFFAASENQDDVGAQAALKNIANELDNIKPQMEAANVDVKKLNRAFEGLTDAPVEKINMAFQQLDETLAEVGGIPINSFEELIDKIDGTDIKSKQLRTTLETLLKIFNEIGITTATTAKNSNNYKESIHNLDIAIQELEGHSLTLGEKISTIGYGLSSFTMSLNSIKSIFETIGNTDLSPFERFTTILGSIGMATPMLINSLGQLNKMLGTTNILMPLINLNLGKELDLTNAQIAAIAAKNLQDNLSIINRKALIQATLKKLALDKTELCSQNKFIIAEKILNIANKKNLKITTEQSLAMAEQIIMLKGEIAATKKATFAQELFNASLLKNPFVIAIMAIGGLIAAYSHFNKVAKENAELEKETKQQQLDEIKRNQEKTKEINELVNNYMSLYHQYKKTGEASEELKNSSEAVIDSLGLEGIAVNQLTGDYEKLSQKIIQAKKDSLEGQIDDADTGVKNAEYLAAGNIETVYPNGSNSYGTFLGSPTLTFFGDRVKKWEEEEGDTLDIVREFLGKAGFTEGYTKDDDYSIDPYSGYMYINPKNSEEAAEIQSVLYDIYNYIIKNEDYDKYKDSSVFRDIEKIVNNEDWQENNEEWQNQKELKEELEAQLLLYNNIDANKIANIEDFSQYEEQKENILNTLTNSKMYKDKTKEELNDIANNFLEQSIGKEDASRWAAREEYTNEVPTDIVNNIINNNKQNNNPNTLNFSNDNEKTKQIIQDKLNKLNDDEFEMAIILGVDEAKSLDALDAYIELAKKEAEIKDIDIKLGVSTDAINSLIQGKDLTEKQLESLKELDSQYEELSSIQDKNSKAYLQQLLQIQQALEEQKITLKEEESNVLIENLKTIDIEANPQDFLDTMKEISDKQYEISVAITADIQSDFDNAVNSMESIEGMASKIGKDFVVAAEDIEELNDVFPGILANMGEIKNGSVQLNAQVVKDAIDSAKKEVQSDTDKTIAKLQNQAAELEVKRDAAKKIADILRKNVGNEKLSAEQKLEIEKALGQLKGNASEAVSKKTQNDLKDQAETSKQASESMAHNFGEAYQQMAEDAAKWGEIAHQALISASDPNQEPPEVPGVGTFGGSSFETTANVGVNISSDFDLNDVDLDNIVDMKELADNFDNLSKSLDEDLNNTLGKIAELTARVTGIGSKFNNIAEGKGSGKNGSKQKHKDTKDKFNPDPFYEINQQLKEIEHYLSLIDKEQAHMAGGALIDSLKNENKLLKEQMKLHKQKLAIAENEAATMKASLAARGVAFNGDNIANYNEMLQGVQNHLNTLITQYDNLSEREQKVFDSQTINPIKRTEQDYERLKKDMDNYVKYVSTVYSEEEAIQDALYKQIENNLKAFEVKVELNLDLEEARRDLADFFNEIEENFKRVFKTTKEWLDLFTTAKKKISSFEGTIGVDMDAINEVKSIVDNEGYNYENENSMFGSRSEAIKYLTELQKKLKDHAQEMYDLYKQTWEDYLSAIDEVGEEWDKILDGFNEIDDTLDHYEKVIELIYGGNETDIGRSKLDNLYKTQVENSLAKQKMFNKQIQALEKERKELFEAGADEADKDIAEIDEAIATANDELKSEIESYIETIKTQLENSVAIAKETMDKSIWGDNLDKVKEDWDDSLKSAEGYYDEVEKIYQLESLKNKWKKIIDDNDSVERQQQLTDLMNHQLDDLKNKNALSEKDVALAEKELAVYQAQIALEDAQEAKNSMKLTRDETGNWTYNYVADEDNINNKRQDVVDKTNEWRTASITAAEDISQKVLETYENFSQRMSDIMTNTTLSEVERDAQIAALNDLYWGEEGIITKAVEDSNYVQGVANRATYEELWSLYLTDVTNYANMSDAEKFIIDGIRESGINSYAGLRDFILGKNGVYDQIEKGCIEVNKASSAAWESMAARAIGFMYTNPGSVRNYVMKSYEDMKKALAYYDKATKMSERMSGVSWRNVDRGIEKTRGHIEEVSDRIQNVIDKTDELSVFRAEVARIEDAWIKVKASISQAIAELEKYLALLARTSAAERAARSSSYGGGGYQGSGNTSGNSPKGPGNPNGGNKSRYWYKVIVMDIYNNAGMQKQLSPTRPGPEWQETTSAAKAWYRSHHTMQSTPLYPGSTKGGNNYFDTGGYTGDWAGGDGRLAVLHSKELVLNKDDTKNILNAVDTIRMIDSESLGKSVGDVIKVGLLSMMSNLTGLNSNSYISNSNTTTSEENIKNTINVEAVFPNANDVEEIREAILSLPNYASQVKMRK